MVHPAPDRRRLQLAELRARIEPPPTTGARVGVPIASGFDELDAWLGGGLWPGQSARIDGPPGAGGVSISSAWARSAASVGEPVLVVDAGGRALPHAWVEPDDGSAPIWVVRPARPAEAWPAVDIALRSGAFGLVVLLDPPTAPRGAGPRLLRLARGRAVRLLLRGDAPFRADALIRVAASPVRWRVAPIGDAPAPRELEITCGDRTTKVRCRDVDSDRLRAPARAADRRPSHDRSRRGGR